MFDRKGTTRMRSRRRRRSRVAGKILAGTCLLAIVLYFGAYAALHVRVPQAIGGESVEYWYGPSRLSNQRRWRSFFDVAHRIDCAVWSDAWDTDFGIDGPDEPIQPLGTLGRGAERQIRMFSQDTSFDLDPADFRLPVPSFFKDGVVPAAESKQ